MKYCFEEEAEALVDRFVVDDTSEDLLHLQDAIVAALRNAYERGGSQK